MLSLLARSVGAHTAFSNWSKLAQRAASTAPNFLIDSVQHDKDAKTLIVKWKDQSEGKFPYSWLRDNAPADHSYYCGPNSAFRKVKIIDLDLEVEPVSCELAQDGNSVEISWPASSSDSPEPQSTSYTGKWLRKRNFTDPQFRQDRVPMYLDLEYRQPWDRATIQSEMDNICDWEKMMSDDLYLATALLRYLKFGILRATNMPTEPGQLARLGEKMGYLWYTHYGAFFNVRKKKDPTNIAFTDYYLPLHIDLGFCENPPEVQCLHVVTDATKGGENQFVDGLNVALQLQKEKPDIYETLTMTQIEFCDHGEDRVPFLMTKKRPVFERNYTGLIHRVNYSNALRAWYFEEKPENYRKVLEALKVFTEYCYQPRNLLEYKMKAGEMTMFANTRVLHGRAEYTMDVEGAERFLEGMYLSYDAVRSFCRYVMYNSDPESYHATIRY